MTATQLKALLASLEPVDVVDANQAYEQRFLHYHWDPDGRVLRFKGMLADADGVVVAKAIEHLAGRKESGTVEQGSGAEEGSVDHPGDSAGWAEMAALASDPAPGPASSRLVPTPWLSSPRPTSTPKGMRIGRRWWCTSTSTGCARTGEPGLPPWTTGR